MRRLGILVALLFVCASCDFTEFGPLADDANGVALGVPDGYPKPAYGFVVAGWSDVQGGVAISRIGVSAGADSQVQVLPLWNGTGVDLHSPSFIGCHHASDCAMGAGASIIGIPHWRISDTTAHHDVCSVAGAPAGIAVEVHCESDGPELLQEVSGPSGAAGFGTSLAAVAGGFVVGAPMAGGPAGALYFVSATDGSVSLLALGAASTGAASIGTLLASAPMAGGDTLVATTAPALTAASRVIVLVLHAGGTADVRACIDDPRRESDGAIALGDLDGDAIPDLVVGDGDGASATMRRDSVEVYFGRDLPATTGCNTWPTAATVVACPDHLRGVSCAGSSFGRALAVGDVDADGIGDLVVGARRATVSGASEAGAVYVLPGVHAASPSTTTADVLTDSSPKVGAHLGASVAVAASRGTRSEVIAGAPESNEAIVFLCSGLANDGPAVGPRCIPAS